MYYVLLYCISVLHMTKPAVSRMHYNCYTYQHNNVASRLWSLERYEHTRQSVSYKDWKPDCLISMTNRGVKNTAALFGTNMCFIPQKSDNQNCHWEQKTFKLVQHNVQDFDCPLCAGKKKSKLLVRWFLYHSRYEWFIVVTQYMAGF